jgi:hypothetical protein
MTDVLFGMLLFRGLDSFLMVTVASHNISTTLKLPMSRVLNFTFSVGFKVMIDLD